MIKTRKIKLYVTCAEEEIKQYNGVENLKVLLLNILDNYACEDYYDPDLVEEFTKQNVKK